MQSESSRITYIDQNEINKVLHNIKSNQDDFNKLIDEILNTTTCDPKHLLTEEELDDLRKKYSTILS